MALIWNNARKLNSNGLQIFRVIYAGMAFTSETFDFCIRNAEDLAVLGQVKTRHAESKENETIRNQLRLVNNELINKYE